MGLELSARQVREVTVLRDRLTPLLMLLLMKIHSALLSRHLFLINPVAATLYHAVLMYCYSAVCCYYDVCVHALTDICCIGALLHLLFVYSVSTVSAVVSFEYMNLPK